METTTIWHRVLRDPQLQELPYKIETNEHDQIIFSPHRPQHGIYQTRISDRLRDHAPRSGTRAVEFAVETSKGVKVPDVIWMSEGRLEQIPGDAEASPVMPEIVVEVLSENNTEGGIAEKRRLYLDEGAGAHDGTMAFYSAEGSIERSALVPSFPSHVD